MIDKIKYRYRFLRLIAPYADGVKRFFVLNFFLSAAILMLGFLPPLFYRVFIDEVVLQGKIQKFVVVLAGYLSVCAMTILLDYAKFFGNNKLTNGTVLNMKYRIWEGLFHRDFSSYETQDIGDTKLTVEDDPNKAMDFFSSQTIDYVMAYLKLLGASLFLFLLDWRLALFSMVVIPVSFGLDRLVSRRESVYNEKMRVNDQSMSSWLHASIQGWREVKALNLQRYERRRFIEYVSIHGRLYAKWVHHWAIRILVMPVIRDELFMQFGLYFLGGLLIVFRGLRIGDLLVFASYYGMLSEAVKTVSTTDAELQSSMPYYERLVKVLRGTEEGPKPGKKPGEDYKIALSDVSFSYEGGDKNVIEHFSLVIEKGERVAITGKSGCGKTTLLKLVTGMVTPKEGSVSFSGIDLREIDIEAMHSRMGYVMQENILLNLSIRENLLYAKSTATEEEMVEACKKAYIYDFIESLPDKLDAVIGERGIKLSGGQRQRIVLARLFLRDVDVFIFDEATSALDQYSENVVQDAIRNIGEDKTIIVVAHRESSVSLCERRIVLGEGLQ